MQAHKIKIAKRICHTRKIKELNALKIATKAVGLFNGTIHFVNINFSTPNGKYGVSSSDVDVAKQYLVTISSIVTKYCNQYGSNNIGIDDSIIPLDVQLTAQTYTDADLQNWTNKLLSGYQTGSHAFVFLNPPSGVENSDAPVSQGVLGYHGYANCTYIFVNCLGSGFTEQDPNQLYAVALSHELAEMVVDPTANLENPEVCDPCAGNCGILYLNYFDNNSNYITSGAIPPPSYAFYISTIVTPAAANDCPAPEYACCYAPGSAPTIPWWQALWDAIVSFFSRLFGSASKKNKKDVM